MIRVAAIQMTSGDGVESNLAHCEQLLARAATDGCRLAVLPENFALMPVDEAQRLACAERDGEGPVQEFLARCAARYSLWLVGGTVALTGSTDRRVRSACLVYGPDGQRVARYDKIHLFDVELDNGERYRESASIEPGDRSCCVHLPWGGLGLSVCYDLRFPELYRELVDGGAVVFAVPSAFTAVTGRDHWETLIRARAIENGSYVIAPNQTGSHANGRQTYGHSMIVDPWGRILGCREQGPGVVTAHLDLDYLQQVRSRLPSLAHRRLGRRPGT